jgi:hypothetical protein
MEEFIWRDNGPKPQIKQCPKCNDIASYSNRVQQMLNSYKPVPDPRAPKVAARPQLRVIQGGQS